MGLRFRDYPAYAEAAYAEAVPVGRWPHARGGVAQVGRRWVHESTRDTAGVLQEVHHELLGDLQHDAERPARDPDEEMARL